MNNEETPYRIVLERRIMELRILLAHSISDSESLELAAKLEEAKAMRIPGLIHKHTSLKRLLDTLI